jgi:hypothetical protein
MKSWKMSPMKNLSIKALAGEIAILALLFPYIRQASAAEFNVELGNGMSPTFAMPIGTAIPDMGTDDSLGLGDANALGKQTAPDLSMPQREEGVPSAEQTGGVGGAIAVQVRAKITDKVMQEILERFEQVEDTIDWGLVRPKGEYTTADLGNGRDYALIPIGDPKQVQSFVVKRVFGGRYPISAFSSPIPLDADTTKNTGQTGSSSASLLAAASKRAKELAEGIAQNPVFKSVESQPLAASEIPPVANPAKEGRPIDPNFPSDKDFSSLAEMVVAKGVRLTYGDGKPASKGLRNGRKLYSYEVRNGDRMMSVTVDDTGKGKVATSIQFHRFNTDYSNYWNSTIAGYNVGGRIWAGSESNFIKEFNWWVNFLK